MNQPLITINILSFNRKDDLRITLQKVFEQDYKNIEVIVVDNNSIDGTVEMVKSDYPSVQLIELEQNIGIAGWNEGFKIAKGEFVLVLDDDAYPEKETISCGVSKFQENTKLGIIAFYIYNKRLRRSESEMLDRLKPALFVGCGALIKKEVFESIGYYDDNYFIYYHEIDFTIRAYQKGFSVCYLKDSKVIHSQSLSGRPDCFHDPYTSKFTYYHYFVGHTIFLLKYFSFRYTLFYWLKWVINRTIILIKYPYVITYFKAFIVIGFKLRKILKKRTEVSRDIQRFYNFGSKPIIDRFFFPDFKKPSFRILKHDEH